MSWMIPIDGKMDVKLVDTSLLADGKKQSRNLTLVHDFSTFWKPQTSPNFEKHLAG